MGFLVDTNVFSELAKSQPDAKVVQWLRRGIEGLASGKRKSSLQLWLTGLCTRMEGRILSFNTSTAHVWGQLVARCDKTGISLPSADSQLAATAHRHGLTMVTRNVADFKNAGVKIVYPFAT